jgi:hypothetical protein
MQEKIPTAFFHYRKTTLLRLLYDLRLELIPTGCAMGGNWDNPFQPLMGDHLPLADERKEFEAYGVLSRSGGLLD